MVKLLERTCNERNVKCLLLWGGADKDLVKRALSLAGNNKWLVPLPWEATLTETGALLTKAQIMISNDSGIMHLASAVGSKALAIFGPTNPEFCGPYGPKGAMVYRKVPCSPCYETPNFYKCPFGRRCLRQLSVDPVYEAVSRLLDDNPPSDEVSLDRDVYLAPSVFRRKLIAENATAVE
jgi:heptosyltransferase II